MSTTKELPPATAAAAIIEITDSSGESDIESSSNKNPSASRTDIDDSTNASDTLDSTTRPAEKTSDATKKIHNRRKSVHHTIKSTEDISFESGFVAAQDEASTTTDTKRQRWDESNINDAIDGNLDDPEMSQLLKKIAYCRVFTNYLLRQYDMLAIDFKLYSNIDLLMLELKKRVDTYTSIRRSRQMLHSNKEDRASQQGVARGED